MTTARNLVGAFVAALAVASSAAIVGDGNFEGDGSAWGKLPKGYSIQSGVGRNGTRALVYENEDPKLPYRFPCRSISLEPGRIYRYSAWVRTENVRPDKAGSGASICIEWTNPDGTVYGAYPGQLRGTQDWTKWGGISQAIPKDAKNIHLALYCTPGCCGKAMFDDVEVEPYEPKPVEGLFSSAYRDEAASGTVTFHAALNLKAPNAPDNVRGTLAYRTADGVARVPARIASATDAVVELDVAKLPMGRSPLGFRLCDASGRELGRASLEFTRVATPTPRKVWFDEHRRTIVDGKPFFPLGMYWNGTINEEKVGIYAKGPFNTVACYVRMNDEQMDLFAAHGIKVTYPLEKVFVGNRQAPDGIRTPDDELRYMTEKIRHFRSHPALLGWYLNDELPVSAMPRLVAHQKLVEREDPDHPTWTVLYQIDQLRQYMGSFDVLGTDPYPIPKSPVAGIAGITRRTREASFGMRPMWQVPQAFDWYAYNKSEEMRKNGRMPTVDEMRSMSWQMIAEGANGLVYYAWQTLWYNTHGVKFEENWRRVCAAAGEVKAYEDVILSVEAAPKVGGVPKDWTSRVWRKGGETYVLVVNLSGKDGAATLVPDCAFTAAEAAFGPQVQAKDRGVPIALKADEPAMIRIR